MTARQRLSEPKVRALARRLTIAAVAVTHDDPLRVASIPAVARHLRLEDADAIGQGIAEAVRRGWLRASGDGKRPAVSVTASWRRARVPRGRGVLPALRSR